MTDPLPGEAGAPKNVGANHPKVREAMAEVSAQLNQIALLFVDGVKLTLLARTPGLPERDFLLTSDDLAEVKLAIDRSANRPAVRGEE